MNKEKRTVAEVRQQVERRLCTKISDSVWQYAVDDRMVSEFQQGESNLEWLAGKIENLIELARGPEVGGYVELSRRQRRTRRIPSRQEAISCYVAAGARREDAVQWYRETFLDLQLLEIEEVEPWILRRQESQQLTHAVIVRLPADTTPHFDFDGHYTIVPPLTEISQVEGIAPLALLDYHGTGSQWVQRIPVGPDGSLGNLYKISKSLAESYGWQRAQATTFVLTGLTPEIPTSVVAFQGKTLGGLARITLAVDPFLTPGEVAQMYERIRSQVLSGNRKGLSEKHTRLAIHIMDHPGLDQSCWKSWNAQYPNWAYGKLNRFKKEALASKGRIEAMIMCCVISPGKIVDLVTSDSQPKK